LWEVVGIPAESLADGTDVRVEVHYDKRQIVRTIEVIKGDKVFEQPKLVAWWQRQRATKPHEQAPAVSVADAEAVEADVNTPESIVADDLPQRR
jgi:hypothetical protein